MIKLRSGGRCLHRVVVFGDGLYRYWCIHCLAYRPGRDGKLPPANDTPGAMLGLMAAIASEADPPHGRYRLAISMYMCLHGWPTLERATVEERGEWVDECEQLAFAIREHA